MKLFRNAGNFKKYANILDYVNFSLFILLFIISFVYYFNSPDIIPTHFNALGNADAYGSKISVFFLPVIGILVFGLLMLFSTMPSAHNYSIEITEENKDAVYSLSSLLLKVICAELVITFNIVQIFSFSTSLGFANGLPSWLIPVELIALFSTILLFNSKLKKYK